MIRRYNTKNYFIFNFFNKSLFFLFLVSISFFLFPAFVDAATFYVKWDASGAADGSSWTGAFTTVSACHTAASESDTCEISGGVSGHTYTENLDITKGITIKGSSESGHSGTVTWNGYKFLHNTSGTITIQNLTASNTVSNYFIRSFADSVSVWEDVIIGPMRIASFYSRFDGGTHTFRRFRWRDIVRTDTNASNPIVSIGAVNITFEYGIFENVGQISHTTAGATMTFKNVLWYGEIPGAATSSIDVGNNATITTSFDNCAWLGVHPVISGANTANLTADNIYWHQTQYGGGLEETTFDSSNKAVVTNDISYSFPYFTQIESDNPMGGIVVRYDDLNVVDDAAADIATLNPEVVVSMYSNGHSLGWPFTGQNVDDLRTIINAGNEVGAHGSSHSRLSSLNGIDISATGTSPSLDISGTRSGDSSTWTGTLTVTINSIAQNYDLATASYDTMEELITALNGASIGDGTVTAAEATADHSADLMSLVLDDVTAQSISSNYTALINRTAFNRFEVIENILDLEAYINSGVDRNGANSVTTSVVAPNPAFVVKTYATAYGVGDDSVVTLLLTDSDILGCSQCATAIGGFIEKDLYGFDGNRNSSLFNLPYNQVGTDNRLFAQVVAGSTSTSVSSALWHNNIAYDGSLANFKTLLTHFGVGDETMATILNRVHTSGDWADNADGTFMFNGTGSDYLWRGDITLTSSSPLIDTGTDVSLNTDYLNNTIYGTPDIGAYEYQPPYTLGTDEVGTTGEIRIYSDGKYWQRVATSTAVTADISVAPQGGFPSGDYSQYMDLQINTWETSGDYSKSFIATSTVATTTVFTVGDLQANTYYTISVDGSADSTALSNGSGQATFTYTGGFSTHTFTVEEDSTAPESFTLSSPSNNTTTTDTTPTLAWNATTDSESGLAKYQLYVDDTLHEDNIATTTTTTTTSALSGGSHTWLVVAIDNAGNTATSTDTYTITISIPDSSPAGNGPIFTGQIKTPNHQSMEKEEEAEIVKTNEMTQEQINAIIDLLQSFRVDEITVNNVKKILIGKIQSNLEKQAKYIFTQKLFKGLENQEVINLQQILRELDIFNYPENTGYFGSITEEAVKQFQCNYNIVCEGIPQTTGYGLVGPKTRTKLNEL